MQEETSVPVDVSTFEVLAEETSRNYKAKMESQNGLSWKGLREPLSTSNTLPWEPSTIPGWSKPCPARPWAFPGMEQPQPFHGPWASLHNSLSHWWGRTRWEGIYLPEAGVDGADEDSEGLPGAAPHGAEDLAEEGDEPQPALHVPLLQLLPHGEILLQEAQRQEAASATPRHHGRDNGCLERELGGN